MKEFNELLDVAEKLLSPEGCPWDQKADLFEFAALCARRGA